MSEIEVTHWSGGSYDFGTRTRIGVSRSTVVSTVPPASSAACQQTLLTVHTSSVGGNCAGLPPQATVSAGSPYAAFCSGPAVTGRCGRSRTLSGSCDIRARQSTVGRSASAGAGISTGALDCTRGLADALGSASGDSGASLANVKPATATVTGTATSVAQSAARRVAPSRRGRCPSRPLTAAPPNT